MIDENKYVLEPLTKDDLSEFFDKTALKVMKYFLSKSIYSQPELVNEQKTLPIHIPKEHLEQWVVQAINAKPIGAGSYPVDVISVNKDWVADVKMLSCKVDKNHQLTNSDSGETSLAQKFSDENFKTGYTLDDLFQNKDYENIWSSWKNIIVNKYEKVKVDLGVDSLYFFFILRANVDFHLCGMKVNLSHLDNTLVNKERSTNDSVWINNYISDEYGHTKVYKAKKRFELRLKPKKWVDGNRVITFNTNFKSNEVSIRELIEQELIFDYSIREHQLILLEHINSD